MEEMVEPRGPHMAFNEGLIPLLVTSSRSHQTNKVYSSKIKQILPQYNNYKTKQCKNDLDTWIWTSYKHMLPQRIYEDILFSLILFDAVWVFTY